LSDGCRAGDASGLAEMGFMVCSCDFSVSGMNDHPDFIDSPMNCGHAIDSLIASIRQR
jgi:hypothetical protein